MSGMPGYDLWKTTDTAYENAAADENTLDIIRERLMNSPTELADIDLTASEELDGETYTKLLSVLADASIYRVLDVITKGGSAADFKDHQRHVFERLTALADEMLEARNVKMEIVATHIMESS